MMIIIINLRADDQNHPNTRFLLKALYELKNLKSQTAKNIPVCFLTGFEHKAQISLKPSFPTHIPSAI